MARARDKLTEKLIRSLKWEGKDSRHSDGGNLYLLVRSSAKYWQQKYSFGKAKWLHLGTYPSMSLREARDERDDNASLIRKGIDPATKKRDERVSRKRGVEKEFHKVASEWFDRRMKGLSEKHRARTQGYLKNQLSPLRNLEIDAIRPSHLTAILDKIEKKGTYNTARRVLRVATQIFEYAHAREYLTGTLPVVGLSETLTATPKVRNRAATTKPKELAPIIKLMWNYSGTPQVEAAMKLQPMLMCRPGELRHMEWSELKADRWVIPEEKMKTERDHIVPLSTQALAVLDELREHTGQRVHAFPSVRRPKYPMSDAAVLVAMRSIGISAEAQTPHGFRAVARTLLDEVLGYRVEVIEMQLAHAVRDATGRAYNRTAFLDQRIEMMQAWADYLERLRKS